ncbi:hypothetical protein EZS27_011238 [termite gut metagenome]|uniref:Uncharacterized protein n=1 Tax=termite gut metagenome TaxID=433724 RepID=A0A5J4S6C0_9ZZZZ
MDEKELAAFALNHPRFLERYTCPVLSTFRESN